jgi:general secretion pathway protein C
MISLTRAWAEPVTQRRLAAGLSVLLAVLLAWLLAKVFWLLLAPGSQQAVIAAAPRANQPSQSMERIELDRYHLFGENEINATVAAFHDAPETALNLALRGIISSSDPESGFAIIVAGGRQAVYGVGQDVPGGAEVRGVYPDRVVLFHAGRYETLRLPVEGPGAVDTRTIPVSGEPPAPAVAAGASIADWKGKLSLNLDTAAQYSLIPVRSGGYRLFLSRDARQMVKLGLRNGDVIRSANGIPLNSQGDVEQVIGKVLSGETLTLLIERDGAEMSLTPDIEQFISGVR